MQQERTTLLPATIVLLGVFLLSSISCLTPAPAQKSAGYRLVELTPIDVDDKHPERRQFGDLTLMGAFKLQSIDQRFGGLSGLAIGSDETLYAVSDRGYWLSAKMVKAADETLIDLIDWQIAPLLTPRNTPVTGSLIDAEALAVDQDGSFLVAFEGTHRIWRYSPPPTT